MMGRTAPTARKVLARRRYPVTADMIQRLTVSKALTAPPFQYARANGFARQRITHPHRPFVVRTST